MSAVVSRRRSPRLQVSRQNIVLAPVLSCHGQNMTTRSGVAADALHRRCPICLDSFEAPLVTKCGHHFCETCIRTALQVKKECPSCREPIASSHRELRADAILGELVGSVSSRAMSGATVAGCTAPATSEATWACGACTMENLLAASRCIACSARRPAAAVALPSSKACREAVDASFAPRHPRPRQTLPRPQFVRITSNDESLVEGSHAVAQRLKGAGLSGYATAFEEAGYDQLGDLDGNDEATLRQVAASCGLSKPGHVMRFVKLFSQPSAAVVPADAAARIGIESGGASTDPPEAGEAEVDEQGHASSGSEDDSSEHGWSDDDSDDEEWVDGEKKQTSARATPAPAYSPLDRHPATLRLPTSEPVCSPLSRPRPLLAAAVPPAAQASDERSDQRQVAAQASKKRRNEPCELSCPSCGSVHCSRGALAVHIYRGRRGELKGCTPPQLQPVATVPSARRERLAAEALRAAEAEGRTLMLAPTASGFRNVSVCDPNRKAFSAFANREGKQVILGRFATAEEAALCFARSPEGRAAAAASGSNVRGRAEGKAASLPTTAAACVAAAQAEGLSLSLLRAKNASGYRGVRVAYDKQSRKDDGVVAYASFSGRVGSYSGRYALPEQAALVFARTDEGRAAAAKAAEATKAALTAKEAHHAAETEGLTLERSQNASGYKNVYMHSSTSFQVQVRVPGGRQEKHLGYFPNAAAGALCLARFQAQHERCADDETGQRKGRKRKVASKKPVRKDDSD